MRSMGTLAEEGLALVKIKCNYCDEPFNESAINIVGEWYMCDDCYEDL